MKFNDAVLGGVLAVFALVEIAYTSTFPSLHGQAYGPDLFPKIIGVGLLLCASVLVVRGIRARKVSTAQAVWCEPGTWVSDSQVRLNVFLVLAAILAYILISDWLGFIPLSIIILTVLLYRLGTGVLLSVVISVVTTFVIYFLFANVLLVPLPVGLLQNFM